MYKVVCQFCSTAASAKKCLTSVKKKIPEAFVEEDTDGGFLVTLGDCYKYSEALDLIHKSIACGFCSGIYTGNKR